MMYEIVPGGTATGPFWQYRIERDGQFSLWRAWTEDLAFVDDPQSGPIRTNVVYWLYARNAQLPDDVPGSLTRELAVSVMVLDSGQVVPVGADGMPTTDTSTQNGTTNQLQKLLGGLVLGSTPVSTDATQTMLTMDSNGRVWQQLIRNLLALTQRAAVSYTGKPRGDIPDINAILFGLMTDSNAALIARALLAIGFNPVTGTGTGGSTDPGTPWVVKSKKCFKRSLTNILDESITNDHLSFGAVSFEKTDFLTTGQQKYNWKSTHNKLNKYLTDAGVYVNDNTYLVSHPIPVTPLTTYTPYVGADKVKYYVAYFDAFGMSTGGASFDRSEATFVPPLNTAYVRCSIPLTQKDTFSLVEGDSILPYQDFYLIAQIETPTGSQALRETYRMNELLALFSVGTQLINPDTCLDNYYIDDAGALNPDASYSVTDYIRIDGNDWYITSEKQFGAFFDADRKPIGGIRFDRPTEKFQTPADAVWVRLSLPKAQKNTYQFQKGQTLSPATYSPILNVETPSGTQALTNSANAIKIANKLTSLIEISDQLYNKDDTANRVGYVVDNFGNETPNIGYLVSPFIAVEPGTWYWASFRAYVSYYEADKQPLLEGAMWNRTDAQGNEQKKFKTSALTHFIKCAVPLSLRNTFMLVQGELEKSLQPFGGFTSPQFHIAGAEKGKFLYVNGTSIDKQGRHPEGVAGALGLSIVNNAVPGGACRRSNKDGSITNNSIYAIGYAMSSTLAEKEDFIANYVSTYRAQLNDAVPRPTTLSNELKEYIRSTSYERSLVPWLNGTHPMPDLFLLNHGINDFPFVGDTDADWTTLPADPYDRGTFIGAMNYIIRVIYSYNPRANIAIISYTEHVLNPRVVQGQQFLADYWGIPILRIDNLMAAGQQRVPGTQSLRSVAPWASHILPGDELKDLTRLEYLIPDRLHYESDPTGETTRKVIGYMTPFVKNLLF